MKRRVIIKEGIECKHCGNLIDELYTHSSEYCQECGAHLLDIPNREMYGENARKVLLRRESKLFSFTYTLQKVRNLS